MDFFLWKKAEAVSLVIWPSPQTAPQGNQGKEQKIVDNSVPKKKEENTRWSWNALIKSGSMILVPGYLVQRLLVLTTPRQNICIIIPFFTTFWLCSGSLTLSHYSSRVLVVEQFVTDQSSFSLSWRFWWQTTLMRWIDFSKTIFFWIDPKVCFLRLYHV